MDRLTKRNKEGIAYMAIADTLPKADQEIESSKPILEGLYAMFQKLADYEDLEVQGKLIKLPLKIGDKVYGLNESRRVISTYEVTSITVTGNSITYQWYLLEGFYEKLDGFHESCLGKTIFLTREEAEKALEQLKED